jgi:predicted transcriptional regulator
MKTGYEKITARKIKWLADKGLVTIVTDGEGIESYIVTAKGLEYLNK